jgi:ADP-ribose pyrophosphatase YjhB (NUDIX family)
MPAFRSVVPALVSFVRSFSRIQGRPCGRNPLPVSERWASVEMMTTGPQITVRIAARVVLLDPANRILLFRYVEPWSRPAIWATPGGGLEPGETDAAAARRDVVEETGLTDVALSPIIWTRESIFDWGAQHVHQHERFFLARIGTWGFPRPFGRRTRRKASNNIAGGRSRS